MPKVTKNLSLEEDAVRIGERYSSLHQTNLSRLVSDFLRGLPLPVPGRKLSPTVSRLLGIAAANETAKQSDADHTYHDHLWQKYGPEGA